jgi:erythrocyte band 7 integral membrane protein
VIAAEGEQKASRALKEASLVISESPAALQLRYLQVRPMPVPSARLRANATKLAGYYRALSLSPQTLNSISAEKNSTIIFPLPMDFITNFLKKGSADKKEE